MEMELIGRHTMVFGLKGAGKSNWVQWLVLNHDAYRNHLCYDVCREHGPLDCYVPDHRSGQKARAEFGGVLERLVTDAPRELRPDLVIGEEVSRYAPNSGGTPDQLMDLVDLNRHYGVGFLGVARRPAKVDATLVELADHIVVFAVRGKNDRRRLNEEAPGAGDAAAEMDPYEYLVIDGTRTWEKYGPVPEMDTTGEI